MESEGHKHAELYWTLGRYDAVVVLEAPSEKEVMKMSIALSEWVKTETRTIPEQKQ